MIYVGQLHVAESQTFFFADGRIPMTGNRIAPLTLYAAKHDLRVCRLPNLSSEVRNQIAIDSLLNVSIDRRRYDFYRALAEGDRKIFSAIKPLLRTRTKDERQTAAICSDFVLLCHVRQGLLLAEHIRIQEDSEYYFYPAEFSASSRFDTFDLPMDRAVKILL